MTQTDLEPFIHRSAYVNEKARIGKGAIIRRRAVIGPDVEVGVGTVIEPGAHVEGRTILGRNNHIYHGAQIGLPAQGGDYKPGSLEIGNNNTVREQVSIHVGSDEHKKTVIGSNNSVYAGSHIGHDTVMGDNNQIIEAIIAGNVNIGNGAVLGGGAHIHQFCNIGDYAFVAGLTPVRKDVPPFVAIADYQKTPSTLWQKLALTYQIWTGNYSPNIKARFLNQVALQRAGFTEQQMENIKKAYRFLFHTFENLDKRARILRDGFPNEEAQTIASFVLASNRGVYVADRELRFLNPAHLFKNRYSYDSTKKDLEEMLE